MIRPVLALGLVAFLATLPARAEPPGLRLPIACVVGRTCLIQNHVDRDPASPGARDYSCGSLTYDGHNGVDFRVPTLKAQRAGVEVLSAARGRVARVRDGVPDVSVRERGAPDPSGRDCGNGIVVDHEDGWETQYCHLARGSVRVRPGESVQAGQPLGQVGLSGNTEYPHLHFTVRQGGRVVDPFAPDPGQAAACGGGASLWSDEAGSLLAYRPGALLNTGFATGPVTIEAVEAGMPDAAPGPDAPALVAFVRAIGLKAGDRQRLVLLGPDGRVLADHKPEPLDRDKAQVMLFSGIRRPAGGWATGPYRAAYTVERAGKVVVDGTFEAAPGAPP